MVASSVQADCQSLLAEQLKSDLSLSYQAFDQTPDAGWRVLQAQRCYSEAAVLIEAWMAQSKTQPNSVKWHLLQMHAYADNRPQALKLVPQLLFTAEQQQKSPFLWNDYVLATAAFLQRDLAALKLHREQLAQGSKIKPNALNLAAVDRLIHGFHLSYQQAYDAAEPSQ